MQEIVSQVSMAPYSRFEFEVRICSGVNKVVTVSFTICVFNQMQSIFSQSMQRLNKRIFVQKRLIVLNEI